MHFLHFIGHPKRGKLPIKKGVENGNVTIKDNIISSQYAFWVHDHNDVKFINNKFYFLDIHPEWETAIESDNSNISFYFNQVYGFRNGLSLNYGEFSTVKYNLFINCKNSISCMRNVVHIENNTFANTMSLEYNPDDIDGFSKFILNLFMYLK